MSAPPRPDWTSRPPAGKEELDAFARVMGESFGGDDQQHQAWIQRLGAERLRIAGTSDEACVGGLGLLPLGLWVGGRAVPCTGVSAVAVAPHVRGSGLAKALVRDALLEAHREGIALSSLYPATLSVYRGVGYGQAGLRVQTRVPLASLGSLSQAQRALPVRRVLPADRPAVEALYERVAMRRDGSLQRDPYIWSRVYRPPYGPGAEWYLIGPEDGPPEGHLGIQRVMRSEGLFHDLVLTDVSLETPRAIERFWSFLASHGSLAVEAVLPRDPSDPVLGVLPEPTFRSTVSDAWMIRLVDLEAAFTQRGWRPGAQGTLEFELEDPLISANGGRWRLSVENGGARLERGGSGALRIDMPGLASLYTGFRDVPALVQLGRAEVREPSVIAAAQALFSGPTFHMPDRF